MAIIAALVLGTTACTDENSDSGTVVSITDGDTLVATVNGKDQTIRLLNIDTPETKDPNEPVECLGPEAHDFLADMLPIGAKIKLMYDVERTDKYDRTLAAVFTEDDSFTSAEIARAGLGTAVVFGKNSKFLPPVQEAEAEAKSGSAGIYDTEFACTLPAQVEAATTALETVTASAPGATAAATGVVITSAAASLAAAKSLKLVLQAGKTSTNIVRWAAFSEAELTAKISLLSTSVEKAEKKVVSLKDAQSDLKTAEAKAAAAKAAAEAKAIEVAAAAKAAEASKAQAAAEAQAAAAAAAAAAEAERIRNLPPVYVPPAPAPYIPPAVEAPAQNSGGGYPGYTGPRCYLPGGKTYRPC